MVYVSITTTPTKRITNLSQIYYHAYVRRFQPKVGSSYMLIRPILNNLINTFQLVHSYLSNPITCHDIIKLVFYVTFLKGYG